MTEQIGGRARNDGLGPLGNHLGKSLRELLLHRASFGVDRRSACAGRGSLIVAGMLLNWTIMDWAIVDWTIWDWTIRAGLWIERHGLKSSILN
jgi:hypothetical protein